jgi:hypothetical protein
MSVTTITSLEVEVSKFPNEKFWNLKQKYEKRSFSFFNSFNYRTQNPTNENYQIEEKELYNLKTLLT